MYNNTPNTTLISSNKARTYNPFASLKSSHLSAKQEHLLAKAWNENQDKQAFDKLVTSHLDLVHGFAYKMRGYGLCHEELVSEGILGLIRAAEKFDHEAGFRFSTYAIWHVRAAIQRYILSNWSIVKTGTTGNQRKLFFNLRRIKSALGSAKNQDISEELGIPLKDVNDMEQRLVSNDISLEAPISSNESTAITLKDIIPTPGSNPATIVEKKIDTDRQVVKLNSAVEKLPQREKYIIKSRHLTNKAMTLVTVAKVLKISHERVRQIEIRALKLLRETIMLGTVPSAGLHGQGI